MYRKISNYIEEYLKSDHNKILMIEGARQIGKTYIIREVGKKLFENYVEINLMEDFVGDRLFEKATSTENFYLRLSMIAGDKLKQKSNTLVFLDEIQTYPHLLTLLKFLKTEDKFTYIASGSLLGVTLAKTSSIPIGSIQIKKMFPMDFEEFLMANGFNQLALDSLKNSCKKRESLDSATHEKMLDLFRKYLLSGGLPDSVKTYVQTKNIFSVREIQEEIHQYYGADASKYDLENKLKIRRIYDMIPSTLENKKKRIVVKDIEEKKGKRMSDYQDEFDYLISAGIALEVKAISTPIFPLIESSKKNLLKLYLNDVGILTNILYKSNIKAILDDERTINLGTVYESVVAQELHAHGYNLFYYDNKQKGEVDFLIDDYENLSVVPVEVKSGKDYKIHSAIDAFLNNPEYNIKYGMVLSNSRTIVMEKNILYLPVYMVAWL